MLTTENHNSCRSQQKMMHKTLTNKQTSTVNLIQVFRFKSWIFCCNDGNSECCSHEIENHLRLHQNFQLQLFHFVKSLSVTLCLTPGNEWVITNCQMRCWQGGGGEERGGQGVMEYHLIQEEKQYKACVLTFRQCLIYLRFVVFLVSFLHKSIS